MQNWDERVEEYVHGIGHSTEYVQGLRKCELLEKLT